MMIRATRALHLRRVLARGIMLMALGAFMGNIAARAQDFDWSREHLFRPGNLVLSYSKYDDKASNVTVGEPLPPNCAPATGGCVVAAYDGTYPYVFNNAPIDGSFGITSRIFLDQITPFGWRVNTLEVPNSLQPWITPDSDQLVTSFSSKSELGLHLSTDGRYLTFMGYVAPVNAIDVSNSNTPGAVDPTNPVGESVYRAVAVMDRDGKFHFTETNAYSGNNGRAAIWNNTGGADYFYASGNAGNGGTPQPNNVVLGAGAQIINPLEERESVQSPGVPTLVGAFSVTELGDKADKVGKDDDFRGITIFDNVL